MASNENAVCLNPNTTELGKLTFPGYVAKCLKGDDATRLNTIFNSLEGNFIQAYSESREQFGNLINTYNGVRDLKTKTNSSTQDADATLNTLEKKKKNLEEELKRYTSEAEAKNQSFLDSILQGTPKETLTPTLQDATLLIFWFGWVLLAVTLVAVRWLSPGGGWRAGLFAAILILLVTLCLYAVLQKVA
jgi:hypothetical protein